MKNEMTVSEKNIRDVSSITSRAKADLNLGHGVLYNQCFSRSDYQTQYEEECPVNYSLKYSETESCKNIKNDEYAETDLDQPTDFSLKYGECSGEEVNVNHKSSECYRSSREAEAVADEDNRRNYSCEDETPLMFSRCSSLNSLSSLEHITQSIPDDRSSIVSDFSRATSGLISPSELPDSPTQTAPCSPKRNKSVCFPISEDLRGKKSVFEDDVATYKQEDTPIEFSRATSLSSLNIDNPAKAEFNLKTNSKASSVTGGDEVKRKDDSLLSAEENHKADNKECLFPSKPVINDEILKNSASVNEDEILISGLSKMKIDENRVRSLPSPNPDTNAKSVGVCASLSKRSQASSSNAKFVTVKPNLSPLFSNHPPYEGSDDDVHTYHTEGTPANISHAGSHSDLSTLSLASGILPSRTANNSENDFFCSESEEALHSNSRGMKVQNVTQSDAFKTLDTESVENIFSKSCTPLEEALVEQCIKLGMPQKVKSKQMEQNSYKFLEDRGIDNWHAKSCTPLEEALVEQCIRLGMPRKNKKSEIPRETAIINERNSIKHVDQRYDFQSKVLNSKTQANDVKMPLSLAKNVSFEPKHSTLLTPFFGSDSPESARREESVFSSPGENWFRESSCTPFEEALVEQCIRLGMSQKNASKPAEGVGVKTSVSEKPKTVAKKASSGSSSNSKSKMTQISSVSGQDKETPRKLERFICNPARRQMTKRKKSRETCRRCRKCGEKSRGVI